MKYIYRIFVITLCWLSTSLLCAQVDTKGTDFWLTFGRNTGNTSPSGLNLQIRIVGSDQTASGTIYFTNLGTSVPFSVAPGNVFTYNLSTSEKQAAYNSTTGTTNHSIHITSDNPVTAYALNQAPATTDATNILPIPALGTEYYQISYRTTLYSDACAIVATENGTQLFHNNMLLSTLNRGQVFYYAFSADMTGAHITADKPVAFFAVNQGPNIPNGVLFIDHIFQQLAPVNTWGKNFFVPVSYRERDFVRIVASQDGTNITLMGGTIRNVTGGQTSLTNLNAGEWVELEISLSAMGCFIQSDKPVGVCAFLAGGYYNLSPVSSDPAQAWVPSIEQTVKSALIAPFIPSGSTMLNRHHAMIITPTATKNNTTMKIGTGPEQPLSGGTWYDHPSGYSFYDLRLTDSSSSYLFSNQLGGLIVMGYGTGDAESYYYLASSAMRTLDAAFYVNDIHYQDLIADTICARPAEFRAEIFGDMSTQPGFLKWYIDNVEETAVQDQITWSKNLADDVYQIKMVVLMDDNVTTKTVEGTLNASCEIPLDIISICQGDSIFFGGIYQKEPGIYFDTLQTTLGFDSIVSIDLRVKPTPNFSIIEDVICQGENYTLYNFNLTNVQRDTIVIDSLLTSFSCDSIVTLNLTVKPASTVSVKETVICQNDSLRLIFTGVKPFELDYTFNSTRQNIIVSSMDTALAVTQTGANPFIVHSLVSDGCSMLDSPKNIPITVNSIYQDSPVSETICQGDSIFFGRKYYKLAGIYTDTLKTKFSCDSIVTLDLMVNPTYRDLPIPRSICQGDSTFFGGRYYKEAGIYYDTLQTKHNCDSIISIDVIINPVYRDLPVPRSICQGDSTFFGRKYYKLAGIHTDTLKTKFNCDSIVTLNLTVNPVYNDLPVSRTICQGDSILFGQKYYKLAGTYTETLKTKFNCDSIVTLNLTVNPVKSTTIYDTICQHQPYNENGFSLSAQPVPGTFIERLNLTTTENCDSIVYLHLQVNPVHTTPIFATICPGDSYDFFSTTLTVGGTYYHTLKNKYNCDSTIILNLTLGETFIMPPHIASVCQGTGYEFAGRIYREEGIYTETLRTRLGCDSVVTLDLTVLLRTDTLMFDTIYVNRAYVGNGFRLPVQREVGTFVETRVHVNANGCEGVARLLLTVLEECEVEPALFFTPNGGSRNDTWIINNLHCLEGSYVIRVYDRFGKKIKDYVNSYTPWDGTYLGKPMPSTDYWYIITAPHREPKVGHFTLMRR